MKRYALLVALLLMFGGTEAMANTIGFDHLGGTGPFTTYSEDGFTVSKTAGNFVTSQSLGAPSPSIYADLAALGGAGIMVTKNTGLDFEFEGIDLWGDSEVGTTYVIHGLDDENTNVFTFNELIVKGFKTVLASDFPPLANPSIRTLTVYGGVGQNPGHVRIDNIRIACVPACPDVPGGDPNIPVPETASLLLLGAGLAGTGIWRWKSTR
jgi:hypothetical protein